MLRIIQNPSDKKILFSFRTDLFKILDDLNLWREGVWMEYWDDQVVNYQFHYIQGYISIASSFFASIHTKEEIMDFFRITTSPGDLKFWASNYPLEVLEIKDPDSSSIRELWKHDYHKSDFWKFPDLEAFKKYMVFKISDSVVIRSYPYEWGKGLKLYSPQLIELKDKIYWFNLLATILYAKG